MGIRVTRSRRAAYGNQSHQIQVRTRWDHSHQVQERSRWVPESPDPGEVQVGTSHQIQVKPRWGPESLGPDEAQVRTRVTRYT